MVRDPFIESVAGPLPVMLWRARPDLSCEFLSREWLDFTGCSAEQALGEAWSGSLHPEDLARWLDACVRAFDTREPFEIEYRLRRRDGAYRWVLDRGLPRYSKDGLFLGFVGTLIDIDERKRAEHALVAALERERKLRAATEEASRLKDGFLATVLQDLHAPVQAIAGWAAQLRKRGAPGADLARGLDAIEGHARAQERMIASLLDAARVTRGVEPAPRAPSDKPLLDGVRVLIVDHDAHERDAMARVLGVAGAETKSAGSAGEALEALRGFRPNVLLSGIGAHGCDGQGLVRASRTPAEPQADQRMLAKPIEPVALLATVARLAHGAPRVL